MNFDGDVLQKLGTRPLSFSDDHDTTATTLSFVLSLSRFLGLSLVFRFLEFWAYTSRPPHRHAAQGPFDALPWFGARDGSVEGFDRGREPGAGRRGGCGL